MIVLLLLMGPNQQPQLEFSTLKKFASEKLVANPGRLHGYPEWSLLEMNEEINNVRSIGECR